MQKPAPQRLTLSVCDNTLRLMKVIVELSRELARCSFRGFFFEEKDSPYNKDLFLWIFPFVWFLDGKGLGEGELGLAF